MSSVTLTSTPDPEPELSLGFVIRRLLITIAVLMALMGLLGYFLKDELIAVSEAFVGALGGWGVMLGFFLADALVLPIPHDAFTTFGLVAGIPFWTCVAWASVGSVVGAHVGFGIGQYLSHTALYRRVMERRGREVRMLTEKYGVIALLVGCLGPLAYSLVCWAGGAVRIRYRDFLLVTLLRIPRVAGYLYLIQLGYLSVVE